MKIFKIQYMVMFFFLFFCIIGTAFLAWYLWNKSSSPPPVVGGVRAIYDIPYINDGMYKHKLDLFLPEKEKKIPMVILVHGGGWKRGDRRALIDVYGDIGRSLAANGIGVAAMSYRLVPEYSVEDQLLDVAAALSWVHQNGAEYGIDMNRIFLCGHSSGAHLASMVAFDPGWLAEYNLNTDIINGLILWSGLYYIKENIPKARFFSRHRIWYPAFGKKPEYWERMSPVTYIEKNRSYLPKTLIMYAEKNFKRVKEQSHKLAELLGPDITGEVAEIDGEGHFSEVFHADESDNQLFERIVKFVGSVGKDV